MVGAPAVAAASATRLLEPGGIGHLGGRIQDVTRGTRHNRGPAAHRPVRASACAGPRDRRAQRNLRPRPVVVPPEGVDETVPARTTIWRSIRRRAIGRTRLDAADVDGAAVPHDGSRQGRAADLQSAYLTPRGRFCIGQHVSTHSRQPQEILLDSNARPNPGTPDTLSQER